MPKSHQMARKKTTNSRAPVDQSITMIMRKRKRKKLLILGLIGDLMVISLPGIIQARKAMLHQTTMTQTKVIQTISNIKPKEVSICPIMVVLLRGDPSLLQLIRSKKASHLGLRKEIKEFKSLKIL